MLYYRFISLGLFIWGVLFLSPNLSTAQMLSPLGDGDDAPGTEVKYYVATCGVWPNGQFDADGNRNPIEFVPIAIPLEGTAVTEDNPHTFGTGRLFEGDDGGDGCGEDKYNYMELQIFFNWWYYDSARDTVFDHDDNKHFWDWYYNPNPIKDSFGQVVEPGYTAPQTCDYTQNCFGYAYGTNNFVTEPAALTGRSVFTDQFHANSCFEVVSTKDAVFAGSKNHAMKVTGGECSLADSFGCVSTPGIFGDLLEFCDYEVISSSSEQFRESGTYTRSISCPRGLRVDRAHREMHLILRGYDDFKSHVLLRRKTP